MFASITLTKIDLNLMGAFYTRTNLGICVMEILMTRFYFNLASKDAYIPDDGGKELKTLHDAYAHARKLIDKILLHVGHDDAEAWKVVILNDEHDAEMILPFSVSQTFKAQLDPRQAGRDASKRGMKGE